jgi:hypothetical protein
MKRFLLTLFLTLAAANAAAQSSFVGIQGALPFTRYASNPIININGSAWYASQIFDFCVIPDHTDATKLIMYASGMASPVETGEISIGKFTSTVANPYVWTEVGQVLTHGSSGAFDEKDVRLGSCFEDSGTYYIYYTGINNSFAAAIGLATSTDSDTFSKSGSNPVLTPTGQGRNDGTHVSEAAVLKEGSSWTMVYSYRNGATVLPGYRYATASTATGWTKGGAGDILTCVSGFYCEFHHLFKVGSDYVIVYESGNTTNPFRLYMASASSPTSDFINSASNPILSESGGAGTWDRYHVATGRLNLIGNQWRLFYAGAGGHDQPYGTNTWSMGVADLLTANCIFKLSTNLKAATSVKVGTCN